MKIFLDDVRQCPKGWILCRTAEEAIDKIRNFVISEISFDHDLGEGMTGYDVACEIERLVYFGGLQLPKWKIHSSNPVGRKNIEMAMKNAEKHSKLI